MKEYLILKDFTGTQDGLSPAESFVAGSVKRLSASLVAALGGPDGGYVKKAEAAAAEIASAPPQLAAPVLEAIAQANDPAKAPSQTIGEAPAQEAADAKGTEQTEDPAEKTSAEAEDRETKVIEPEETKPTKPKNRK